VLLWRVNVDSVHVECMRKALALARKCRPIPTAFCVGCVVTKTGTSAVIASGYSRELEGNTHAEECALRKLLLGQDGKVPTGDLDLYTTMEPCSLRLSGNSPCTDRILAFNRALAPSCRIANIYLAVVEPSDFVNCDGINRLHAAGLSISQVQGFQDVCLRVARGQDPPSN